ncbi:MAG: prolipoprotein diacylglyceryl transferase [Alphaproteobacteria bacterium]
MLFDLPLEFPNIDPVALALGPIQICWYAARPIWRGSYWVMAIACIWPLSAGAGAQRPNREDIDDFLPWVILGVILGGRIGYVLFYQFELYAQHPLEALKIWHGGMSFHGGALGVIAALIIYPIVRKFPHLRLADMVCACVPIGLFFGRVANFINGELFGRITDSPLGMVFPDGGLFPRHPSQLYEAVLEGAVLFVILSALIHIKVVRERPGIISGAFLFGYGSVLQSCFNNFVSSIALFGLLFDYFSMGQLLSVPMMLAGLGLIAYALFIKKRPEEEGV